MTSSVIGSFDARADAWLETIRGNKLADRIFNTASTLGDFSVIWHLVGAVRLVRALASSPAARRPVVRQSMELSVLLGAESLLVNQGIKRLFKRVRPTPSGDDRYDVRAPTTSSFPSGHASSAFFAASVLTSMTSKRCAPLWFAVAAIVALSRPYIRIHHASDIVGGAAVGLTLGVSANWLRKRLQR